MHLMSNGRLISLGLMLGLPLAGGLTGCVEESRPSPVYVAAPAPEPVFVEQDDYVYYPRYGVYYGNRSHRYYYPQGRAWVAQPAPRGVSVEVLHSSPTVRLDFHDAPAAHHSQVVRTYPRRWKPADDAHGKR